MGPARPAPLGWWLYTPGRTWPRGGHLQHSVPEGEIRSASG